MSMSALSGTTRIEDLPLEWAPRALAISKRLQSGTRVPATSSCLAEVRTAAREPRGESSFGTKISTSRALGSMAGSLGTVDM